MTLIKLPNGDWINPDHVSRIKTDCKSPGGILPDRTTITLGLQEIRLDCANLSEAEALRDAISDRCMNPYINPPPNSLNIPHL